MSANAPSEDILADMFLLHYAAHLSVIVLRQVVIAGRQLFRSLSVLKQSKLMLYEMGEIVRRLRNSWNIQETLIYRRLCPSYGRFGSLFEEAAEQPATFLLIE